MPAPRPHHPEPKIMPIARATPAPCPRHARASVMFPLAAREEAAVGGAGEAHRPYYVHPPTVGEKTGEFPQFGKIEGDITCRLESSQPDQVHPRAETPCFLTTFWWSSQILVFATPMPPWGLNPQLLRFCRDRRRNFPKTSSFMRGGRVLPNFQGDVGGRAKTVVPGGLSGFTGRLPRLPRPAWAGCPGNLGSPGCLAAFYRRWRSPASKLCPARPGDATGVTYYPPPLVFAARPPKKIVVPGEKCGAAGAALGKMEKCGAAGAALGKN
eukprot:gene7766-biopygen16581